MKKLVMLFVVEFVLVLALCSCDKVVKVEENGPAFHQTEVQSCTHTSFCVTCLPGFDGKMDCGAKMSAMCPGTQRVLVRYQPVREYRESGKVVDTEYRNVIEQGQCY